MEKSSSNRKKRPVAKMPGLICLLGSLLALVFFYIVLHEAGHALVALAYGAKIIEFSILGAHVSIEGGSFDRLGQTLYSAGGALLPLLASACYMAFYQPELKSPFYRFFSAFLVLLPLSSSMAWLVIPFLYRINKAPAGDDVTRVLDSWGLDPLLMPLLVVAILALYLLLAWKKRIIQNLIEVVREDR